MTASSPAPAPAPRPCAPLTCSFYAGLLCAGLLLPFLCPPSIHANALQRSPSTPSTLSTTPGAPATPASGVIQFKNKVEQASQVELKFRLHSQEDPAPFQIEKESFQLVVPKEYNPAEAWGVLVWVDASDNPRLPPGWEQVLATRKLIYVSALRSGNPRDIFDRIRMAVHANVGMRERFKVDPRRVYVSGFSGGARVASMLGVAWADMFTGAIPFMGVNFYTDISLPNGKVYPPSYIPHEDVLEIARKRCRYVLVTGEKDFNKPETQAVFEHGFQKERFAYTKYLEIPGHGHSTPPAQWLEAALNLLEPRASK